MDAHENFLGVPSSFLIVKDAISCVGGKTLKVYNNDDDITFFSVLTFAKPSCDNALQPSPLPSSGCITLSHLGLANINKRKRMFYSLSIVHTTTKVLSVDIKENVCLLG